MKKKAVFLVLFLFVCMPITFLMPCGWKPCAAQAILSKTASPAQRTLAVLFIGNSFTFVNDLPQMLADIASSDAGSRTRFEIRSVTRPGAHFSDLWNDTEGKSVIASQHWDYVVLQDNSTWALYPGDVLKAHEYGAKFAGAVRQSGGTIVLYETWVRRPGSAWYTSPVTAAALRNPDYMHTRLHDEEAKLAGELKAAIVPMGDLWMQVLQERPALDLYRPDSWHASPAGTYLAALLFYRRLSGNDLDHVTYVPSGMNTEDAVFERKIVMDCK